MILTRATAAAASPCCHGNTRPHTCVFSGPVGNRMTASDEMCHRRRRVQGLIMFVNVFSVWGLRPSDSRTKLLLHYSVSNINISGEDCFHQLG